VRGKIAFARATTGETSSHVSKSVVSSAYAMSCAELAFVDHTYVSPLRFSPPSKAIKVPNVVTTTYYEGLSQALELPALASPKNEW